MTHTPDPVSLAFELPDADYVPNVAEVGALLRARTRDTAGEERGTFVDPDVTRPNKTQAEHIIGLALNEVSLVVNPTFLPVSLNERFRHVVSLGAAGLIELSYYPEQVATGRSPYTQIQERYAAALATLADAVKDAEELDSGGESAQGYPSFGGFPTTGIGMEFPW